MYRMFQDEQDKNQEWGDFMGLKDKDLTETIKGVTSLDEVLRLTGDLEEE